jgi:hypothetical protein
VVAAAFNPSLYYRTNVPGDVHLAIIRGTPSSCAEISSEYQARSYDEPNGEAAHALVPGAISDFSRAFFAESGNGRKGRCVPRCT